MTDYTYADPTPENRQIFIDQSGHPHLTREEAVTANITADLEKALRTQFARAWPDDHDERAFMARVLVGQLAGHHNRDLRQMVFDLLEATG